MPRRLKYLKHYNELDALTKAIMEEDTVTVTMSMEMAMRRTLPFHG